MFYKKGGWKNHEMIGAYHRYAKICLDNFGDRVNYWLTFNEPWVEQYLMPIMMKNPGIKKSGEVFADCLNSIHNLFIAHAKVIETFHEINKNNKVGIALNLGPGYPNTNSDYDKEAAKNFDDFLNKWFLELAIHGRYPSRLYEYYQEAVGAPQITDRQKNLLKKNKSDFIGVNYYGPFIIKASNKNFPLNYDTFKGERSKDWANNAKVVPEGLFEILMRIKEDYGNPLTFITENGCSYGDEEFNDIKDEWRIDYVKKHLKEVKRAIDNGVNVKRYYLWSLMDNLEWIQGYKERYGIIFIDREHDLERKIKNSGKWYSKLIKTREFTI
jgi:beta-glucosidase/6-phospho-beta-glucosidase/beta-galactosidase